MQSVSSFKSSEWTGVYLLGRGGSFDLRWHPVRKMFAFSHAIGFWNWNDPTGDQIKHNESSTIKHYFSISPTFKEGPVHPVPPHVSTFLILHHESSSPRWFLVLLLQAQLLVIPSLLWLSCKICITLEQPLFWAKQSMSHKSNLWGLLTQRTAMPTVNY